MAAAALASATAIVVTANRVALILGSATIATQAMATVKMTIMSRIVTVKASH